MIRVEVPGKVMLAGEYGVLAGGRALATTVDLALTVEISAGGPADGALVTSDLWSAPRQVLASDLNSDVQSDAAALVKAVAFGLNQTGLTGLLIAVRSQLAVEYGVGSSSALRLAVLLGLRAFAKQQLGEGQLSKAESWSVAADALQLQRAAQPKASGYDIATQLAGGIVIFHPLAAADGLSAGSIDPVDVPELRLKSLLHLFVGGRGAPTAKVMGRTLSWWQEQDGAKERMEAFKAASEQLVQAFVDCFRADHATLGTVELPTLVKAVAAQRSFLAAAPDAPTALFSGLHSLPEADQTWSYKTTGAGGEDALLLIGPEHRVSAAKAYLTANGWRPLPAGYRSSGARLQAVTQQVIAQAPSNIAFVKYWGKSDEQLQWPANDSLSMTLSHCRTITTAEAQDAPFDSLLRRGKELRSDTPEGAKDKGLVHLARLRTLLGFSQRLHLTSENTFPEGCGIASSASGLAALTLAAVTLWTGAKDLADLGTRGFPMERLARLARLGSGSACRSLYGGFVQWHRGASADDAKAVQTVEPLTSTWKLADLVLVISPEPKTVSSSEGHKAAWSSPLFRPRLAGMAERMERVRQALVRQDLASLGCELEAEALDMHAVMLSGTPQACYIGERTAQALAWVREQRRLGMPAYFTLDAGPNLHIICEQEAAPAVAARLKSAFPDLQLIEDTVGTGPMVSRRTRT